MLQALYARLIDPARPLNRIAVIIVWAILLNTAFLALPHFIRGGDAPFHLFNTQQFATGLREGVLYPRWLGDFYNGYGAPIGIGYAPLTYFSGSAFMLLGFDVFTALKVALTLSLVISGLGMYRLARRILPVSGALVAALAYQAMPYYVIDLYSRAALGEYIGFAWLPFIFLFAYQCATRQRLLDCALLAFTVGGLTVTHILTAYMTALGLAIFALVLIVQAPQKWFGKALRLGVAGGLGIGLAAIYVLPLLSETSYLNANYLIESAFGNYQNNFLFNAWGYLGTEFSRTFLENSMIGVGALLTIALVSVMAVILYQHWRVYPQERRQMALAVVVVFGFSTFMMFSVSSPLWAILPRAAMLQFPTRWQTLSALSGAYLAGEIISWLIETRPQQQRRRLQLFVMCIIGGNVIYGVGLVGALTYLRRDIGSELAAQVSGTQSVTKEYFGRIFPAEYQPQWVTDLDIARETPVDPEHGIYASDESTEVSVDSWQLSQRVFTATATQDTTINLKTFWFPGWQASVNGAAVETQPDTANGLISFTIPAGASEIALRFEDTPVRSTGGVISLVCLVILGGMTVYDLSQRQRQFLS